MSVTLWTFGKESTYKIIPDLSKERGGENHHLSKMDSKVFFAAKLLDTVWLVASIDGGGEADVGVGMKGRCFLVAHSASFC